MSSLTSLQRRILVALEEAGEENFTALTNTVNKPLGLPAELRHMQDALKELLEAGLIQMAESRDVASRMWVPVPMATASVLIGALETACTWSQRENLWIWNRGPVRLQVLITEAGKERSREILSKEGWSEGGLRS